MKFLLLIFLGSVMQLCSVNSLVRHSHVGVPMLVCQIFSLGHLLQASEEKTVSRSLTMNEAQKWHRVTFTASEDGLYLRGEEIDFTLGGKMAVSRAGKMAAGNLQYICIYIHTPPGPAFVSPYGFHSNL